MSGKPGVDIDQFPAQGTYLGKKVTVCFNYDSTHTVPGEVVRDDVEGTGFTIIKLDDGRYVLSTECQYSPL